MELITNHIVLYQYTDWSNSDYTLMLLYSSFANKQYYWYSCRSSHNSLSSIFWQLRPSTSRCDRRWIVLFSASRAPMPVCWCGVGYYVNQSPITESDIDFPYASTSLDKDTGV